MNDALNTRGYGLEENIRHGRRNVSNLLLGQNLLPFLFCTVRLCYGQGMSLRRVTRLFLPALLVLATGCATRPNVSQTRIPTSQMYRAEAPIYIWYEQIGELRGSTDDSVRTTFIVEPYLGYNPDNDQLTTELIQRRIQLIGIFNDYFGSRSTSVLEGAANRIRVQQELQDQINRILRSGRIEDIVFGSYQFLPF